MLIVEGYIYFAKINITHIRSIHMLCPIQRDIHIADDISKLVLLFEKYHIVILMLLNLLSEIQITMGLHGFR